MIMRLWIAVPLVLCAWPAASQAGDEATRAVGVDFFASNDADNTAVFKTGLTFDFDFADPEHYTGVCLETFVFASSGERAKLRERGYVRFAGSGTRWKWNGEAGTDGRTFLGSGTIHTDEAFRQEYFVERNLVETPVGLRRGLYFTFAGASYDIPLDDRNTATFVAGVQSFTGKNYRLHLRGTYVYAVVPEWGLSLQLRSRSFWNSTPHEFDYFSPDWYFEAIPTVQMRRFYARWQYLAAFGWGLRRDPGTAWKSARLANLAVVSPPFGREWYVKASFLYSNMPVIAGYTYNYEQATLSLTKTL